MEPGSRSDEPGRVMDTNIVELSELEWRVLEALKRELAVDEIGAMPWRARADEAGVSYEEFLQVSRGLAERGVIGRFSTFLEHVKPGADGVRVTRYNALFHWRVPRGARDRGGERGGAPPHPHARVLARGRRGVREREHHGRRARHRQAARARAQGGDRRASRRGRDSGELHERVLGRAQRDQAERDRAGRVRAVAAHRLGVDPERCARRATRRSSAA